MLCDGDDIGKLAVKVIRIRHVDGLTGSVSGCLADDEFIVVVKGYPSKEAGRVGETMLGVGKLERAGSCCVRGGGMELQTMGDRETIVTDTVIGEEIWEPVIVPASAREAAEGNASEPGTEALHGMIEPPEP